MQIANIGKHSMAEIGISTKKSLKIKTKMCYSQEGFDKWLTFDECPETFDKCPETFDKCLFSGLVVKVTNDCVTSDQRKR